ncbi:hypothetical protein CLV92_101485 [Kineococcus xinjiangensis]|uniref:MinD-like ATPase involved in chromosome partitioning or flagellar assembly n=1 Tax=Kineococcus xinjiangensis TaxID=512762 RepID=A0A2S6IWQ6_9ACTN|nr:hypothetical protein [Kineococcus xinjiangensis]PPK98784.1 hypothetical protein CLV92_101485 [Kineococcus xinjiangensis]
MSLVTLCSAKGSPGVTTSAALLAALWPGPVLLVDADTDGGDLALRLPGADGRPLDQERGVLPLLTSARRGLRADALLQQAQTAAGGTDLLCGVPGPEQALAASASWPVLARACADLASPAAGAVRRSVVADAGRVSTRSEHLDLLLLSDVVVLVFRPSVSGVVQARERLRALAPVLRPRGGTGPHLALLAVAGPTEVPALPGAVATIRRAAEGAVDLGCLALDARGAAVFDGAAVRRPERTLLVRSARPVVAALAALAAGPQRRAVAPAVAPAADAALLAAGGSR